MPNRWNLAACLLAGWWSLGLIAPVAADDFFEKFAAEVSPKSG